MTQKRRRRERERIQSSCTFKAVRRSSVKAAAVRRVRYTGLENVNRSSTVRFDNRSSISSIFCSHHVKDRFSRPFALRRKDIYAGAGFARASVITFATRPMISLLSILSGTLAIRNDRTSSRSSKDDPVLSASSYAGPQRTTLSSDRRDESLTFQRTSPAFRLETSKSVYSYDNKNEIRESRSEEPIDQLTSSKHVDHIDGNNIEVKSGEYYR